MNLSGSYVRFWKLLTQKIVSAGSDIFHLRIRGRCHCFDMYGLLTKCEVKMAGYWPSSFFACLWTETKSRSINSQKKNEANIQPS